MKRHTAAAARERAANDLRSRNLEMAVVHSKLHHPVHEMDRSNARGRCPEWTGEAYVAIPNWNVLHEELYRDEERKKAELVEKYSLTNSPPQADPPLPALNQAEQGSPTTRTAASSLASSVMFPMLTQQSPAARRKSSRDRARKTARFVAKQQ